MDRLWEIPAIALVLIFLFSGAQALTALTKTPISDFSAPLSISEGQTSFSAQFGNDAVIVNECIVLNGLRTDISNLTSLQKSQTGFDKDFTKISKFGAGYKVEHSFIEPSIGGISIGEYCWLVDSPTSKITENGKALHFANGGSIDWSAEDGNGFKISFEKINDYSYAVYADLSKVQNKAVLIDPFVAQANYALATVPPYSKVARSITDANLAVTWAKAGTLNDLNFATSVDGNAWGSIVLTASGRKPSIDVNSTGGWVVAYVSGAATINVMTCSKDCNISTANWITSNNLTGTDNPSIVVSADNNINVVFQNGADTLYSQCTSTGQFCSLPVTIPNVTANSGIVTAFDINSTGGKNIIGGTATDLNFAGCSRDCNVSAANWLSGSIVSGITGADPYPSLIASGDGNLHLAYNKTIAACAGNFEVTYKRCAANCSVSGNWSADYNASGKCPSVAATHSQYPAMTVDGNSNLYVYYADYNSVDRYIFTRKRNRLGIWDNNAMRLPNTLNHNYPNLRRRTATKGGVQIIDLVDVNSDLVLLFDANGVGTVASPPLGSFDANFNWKPIPPTPLDPDNSITTSTVDFNNTSSHVGKTLQDYNWLVDGVSFSTDENASRTFSIVKDFNVCFEIVATDATRDIQCNNIQITQYPQDVNFAWNPIPTGAGISTNFDGNADSNALPLTWSWSFADGNTMTNQSIVKIFAKGGTYNVCLSATDSNGLSKNKCYDVLVYGRLRLQFKDETTLQEIGGATIDFNGNSYLTGANGIWDYNLMTLSQDSNVRLTVTASKVSYGTRYFTFDLNRFINYDINALLLKDINGAEINFEFWNSDKTAKLTGAKVEVKRAGIDQNYAGIRYTNDNGEISFFLNPKDANNFDFNITASNSTRYNYRVGNITMKVPLDSKTGIQVSPYNVRVVSLMDANYGNLVADKNGILVYTNTKGFYKLIVDSNASSSYWQSNYAVKFQGADNNITIQPYLVGLNDGYPVTFTTLTSSQVRLSDIELQIYKGGQFVASGITDSKGEFITALQDLQYYKIKVYKDSSLIAELEVLANGYNIYIYLDTASWDISTPVTYGVTIDMTPQLSDGNDTIVIDIGVLSPDLIQDIRYWVMQNDVNLGGIASLGTLIAGVPDGTIIRLDVNKLTPTVNDRNILYTYLIVRLKNGMTLSKQILQTTVWVEYNLVTALRRDIKSDFGCSTVPGATCGFTVLLALMVTLGICIWARLLIGIPLPAIGGIAIALLAFFTFIDFIPIYLMAIGAFAGFATMVFGFRGQ